ncbi:36.4 kDa proline-rich protein-like [Sinocyclocheilus anshuiensis]|uniref:36.4 kDa proline-rich protein-like n=1 Tax=Sinocyclocheilus anshuiensis TaxID=1608454 RepID=A0A671MB29_9TELE|nr:PREDICTED: 36.4 kDa proline-rich protein-like [Sinocyclocheilus anshuiensis]
MGAPVRMSCPVSPRLSTVSCLSTGMIATLGVRADVVKVLVDGSWQPLLLMYTRCSFTLENTDSSVVVTAPFTGSCWLMTDTEMQLPLMYGDREVTLSCPLTRPTIAPTMPADPDMQQMFDPFPFGRPWWYPPYYPGVPATLPPTVPPTTTTTPPFQCPFQQHMYPQMYPRPVFDPYFYSRGDPAAPPAPQQPQHPWYPNFPPYMNGFQSPVEVTIPATTTTTPASDQPEKHPIFPPLLKSYMPPVVEYPFMPKYPKDPVFGPRSPKSVSYNAQLSSVYRP